MHRFRTALRYGMGACLLAIQIGTAHAAPVVARSILGTWLVEDQEAAVQIYPCGEEFCGRIAWLKEPLFPADDDGGMAGKAKTDRNNQKAVRRTDPVLGSTVLHDLRFNGSNWEHGRLYDPDTGNIYTCIATLTADNRLEIRGYVGFSILGRTVVWTRMSDND